MLSSLGTWILLNDSMVEYFFILFFIIFFIYYILFFILLYFIFIIIFLLIKNHPHINTVLESDKSSFQKYHCFHWFSPWKFKENVCRKLLFSGLIYLWTVEKFMFGLFVNLINIFNKWNLRAYLLGTWEWIILAGGTKNGIIFYINSGL